MDSSTIIAITFFSLNIIGILITVFAVASFSSSSRPTNSNNDDNNVSQQQRYHRAFPTANRNDNIISQQMRCRPSIHVSQLQRCKTSRRHPFGCHAPSSE